MAVRERAEDYLGAIHRLREAPQLPLPLSILGEYFGFSPVSIHEMVQKLSQRGWIVYHPYHGVTLTGPGEAIAGALVRRHRLWERFLTDVLNVPWDEAHEIAGNLEHAAPESVTERLAGLLGDPDSCPHGEPIPPSERLVTDRCLDSISIGDRARVSRIGPESAELLRDVQAWGLLPGRIITVVEHTDVEVIVQVEEQSVHIPLDSARAIWVEVLC